MTLVTQESNASGDVTLVTRNVAPLTNAERQRLYRERQRLKKGQATQPSANNTNGGEPATRPKLGGHKPRGSERYQQAETSGGGRDRQEAVPDRKTGSHPFPTPRPSPTSSSSAWNKAKA